MSPMHGQFVWYELMTTDLDAAEAFYSRVVGWTTADSGVSDPRYTLLSAGGVGIGGAMTLPAEALAGGARPGWTGYIAVDDVDASAAKLLEAGGTVHRAAGDIPNVGRFAMVADPQGAHFVLFKGARTPPPAPAAGAPGHAGWRELATSDQAGAFDFYSGLFGWTKADAIDMGPMGIYQLLAAGGPPFGAMMTKNAATPVPYWLYYFGVDDIDAAAARVKAAGGQVINGPHQVPSGDWIAGCIDPQGAVFAVLGPHV